MHGNFKHGQSKTRLHIVWMAMIQRCEDSNASNYKYYGGRGISVCREWRKDFMIFKRWALANGYREGLTIDRTDNDGDYKPENCRFATRKEQNRNYRRNRLVKIGDQIKLLIEWAEQAGIRKDTLRCRLEAGWPEYRLLDPVKKYNEGG